MAMDQYTLQTAFADAAIAEGREAHRNVTIMGPGGFLATFRDTPENRERARLLAAAPVMVAALEEARTQVSILQERLGIVDPGTGTLSIIDAALAKAVA